MQTKERLDQHYETYRRNSRQDTIMRSMAVRSFLPFIQQSGTGLEFGCSDGYMTQMLAQRIAHIDVVEGSSKFIAETQKRNIPNARFYHTMFEEFVPEKQYDYVFATYVLTHIADVTTFFRTVKSALKQDGMAFFVVPNTRSISRQLALQMGLIESLSGLTENDKNHGHVRAYTMHTLNQELHDNQFTTIATGGLMMKPLSDAQMDTLFEIGILADAHIEGLYQLGNQYPDLCSACYSICRL